MRLEEKQHNQEIIARDNPVIFLNETQVQIQPIVLKSSLSLEISSNFICYTCILVVYVNKLVFSINILHYIY